MAIADEFYAAPYSDEAESGLIAAALLYPAKAETVAKLDPHIFYTPKYRYAAIAIAEIVSRGDRADAVSVSHTASVLGYDSPTAQDLIKLISGPLATSNAQTYIDVLYEKHRARKLEGLGENITLAVRGGDLDKAGEALDRFNEVRQDEPTHSSWDAIDLNRYITTPEDTEPTIFARSDGRLMIYPGQTHAFNGESESGKSWLALAATAQEMEAEHHVIYVDFETAPGRIVSRLKSMGVPNETIASYFHYVRPFDAIGTQSRSSMGALARKFSPTLAILDGITEALSLNGWNINDNNDVAQFGHALPNLLAGQLGVATVMIDHVTKDSKTRERWAIGAQHKLAMIDVAYSIEMVRPFGRGSHGIANVRAAKDRNGFSRRGEIVAELHVSSKEDTDEVSVRVTTPEDRNRPTVLMERASKQLETAKMPLGRTAWAKLVPGNRNAVIAAIDVLIEEGSAIPASGGSRPTYVIAQPYRNEDF